MLQGYFINIIRLMRFDKYGDTLGKNYSRVIELGNNEVGNKKIQNKTILLNDFSQLVVFGFQLSLVEYFLARSFLVIINTITYNVSDSLR